MSAEAAWSLESMAACSERRTVSPGLPTDQPVHANDWIRIQTSQGRNI